MLVVGLFYVADDDNLGGLFADEPIHVEGTLPDRAVPARKTRGKRHHRPAHEKSEKSNTDPFDEQTVGGMYEPR